MAPKDGNICLRCGGSSCQAEGHNHNRLSFHHSVLPVRFQWAENKSAVQGVGRAGQSGCVPVPQDGGSAWAGRSSPWASHLLGNEDGAVLDYGDLRVHIRLASCSVACSILKPFVDNKSETRDRRKKYGMKRYFWKKNSEGGEMYGLAASELVLFKD